MALEPRAIAKVMLAWYDREARALPWRAPPMERQDPYKVWLSEIMLQQTTVKAVAPRYIDFLRRWPNVAALARAELGKVLAAWAGLGYTPFLLKTKTNSLLWILRERDSSQ